MMDPPGPSNVAEGADSTELIDLSQDRSGDLSPGRSHPALVDSNIDILSAETINFACKEGSLPERL